MSEASEPSGAPRLEVLAETGSTAGAPLGLGRQLTSSSARRRLWVLGVFLAPAWVVGWLSRQAMRGLGAPLPHDGVALHAGTLAGIVGSLVVVALALRVSSRWVALLGMAYATLNAAIIEAQFAFTPLPEMPLRVMPWTTLIIVFFPAFLQWRVRPTVAWALVTGAIPAASVLIAGRLGGPQPTTDLLFHWVFTPPFAAALALVTARLLAAANEREARALARVREFGSYRLFEEIGRGGMGEVWRAEHRLLSRPVAVKLIRPDKVAASTERRDAHRRRFLEEARATAELDSPHTVALFDFGVAPDGSLFYVMELLEGMTLEQAVKAGGPMPPERVVSVARQICRSLGEAHGRGLVHRDIKPANVMLCRFAMEWDFVKILDFGIVRRVRETAGSGDTQAGSAIGTPGFMAPEASVAPSGLDHRADLYSLGCVLWYALCGAPLFKGKTPMDTVVMHARDEVPAMPVDGVPPELEALVRQLLAKETSDRPSSAHDVVDTLDAIQLEPWTDARAAAWWQEFGEVEDPTGARQVDATWEFQTRS